MARESSVTNGRAIFTSCRFPALENIIKNKKIKKTNSPSIRPTTTPSVRYRPRRSPVETPSPNRTLPERTGPTDATAPGTPPGARPPRPEPSDCGRPPFARAGFRYRLGSVVRYYYYYYLSSHRRNEPPFIFPSGRGHSTTVPA